MLELQENIARVLSATGKLRRTLVDHATREYFDTLDPIRKPAASDFEAAEARAYAVVKDQLLAPDSIALISEQVRRASSPDSSDERGHSSRPDDDAVAAVALAFDGVARPVQIAKPIVAAETKTVPLALAGAAGAVIGMLVLAPLLRLAFDMRELGLVLGAPLGALLAVLVMHRLARLRFLTRVLPWVFVRPKTLRGAVRSEHERAVRASIGQWVDWAVPMLAVLCSYSSGRTQSQTDRDKALRRIGKLVYALHGAPVESLPVVAHELIQEAKNAGFENLEGTPAFLSGRKDEQTMVWRADLQGEYETFGHISEGDQVVVERLAVILGGRVMQRGLVRKVREKT